MQPISASGSIVIKIRIDRKRFITETFLFSDRYLFVIEGERCTLDVYGHVTDDMKRNAADKGSGGLKGAV